MVNEYELGFFSIKEFSKKLGVHENTIRRSIKSGRINAFRIGSGKKSIYRIPYCEIGRMAKFDLDEYIEKIIEKRSKKD